MRKVTVSEFISLDGVIENPQWTAPYWNDEIADFKFNELFSHDALLLGRVTYEGFAQAWPGRTDEKGYGDRMNNLPKHVVSTTLTTASWNNSSIIRADVFDEIAKLKQQAGQDILIFGSGKLVASLIEHDLIDRYNLIVYPVVIGSGQRLFDGLKTTLKLVEARPVSSGAVVMIYQPAREEGN